MATASRWFLASLALVFAFDVLITLGFFFGTQERTGYSLAGICGVGLVVAIWRSRREHLAYEAMLAAEREAEKIASANSPPASPPGSAEV